MRTFLLVLAFGVFAAPALAQFSPPGGLTPYAFGAPETGLLGASAAGSAAGATVCHNEYVGRSGTRTQCDPAPTPPPPGKK